MDAQRELHRAEQDRADRREFQSKEDNTKMDVRLKRANDIMRGILYHMNAHDPGDIPMYFESVERLFTMNSIEEDLWISLLTPFLDDKSRRLMSCMSANDLSTFDQLRNAILREHRLTPMVYRNNFTQAVKNRDESYILTP